VTKSQGRRQATARRGVGEKWAAGQSRGDPWGGTKKTDSRLRFINIQHSDPAETREKKRRRRREGHRAAKTTTKDRSSPLTDRKSKKRKTIPFRFNYAERETRDWDKEGRKTSMSRREEEGGARGPLFSRKNSKKIDDRLDRNNKGDPSSKL